MPHAQHRLHFRLRWIHYVFGFWGLVGLAACWLNLIVPRRDLPPWVSPKGVLLLLFFAALPPFLHTIFLLNRMGLNVREEAPASEKSAYLARCRQTWKAFPISASLVLLTAMLPIVAAICSVAWLSRLGDPMSCFLGVFYAIPAFVNFRLLPAGLPLVAQWQREDGRVAE